MRKKLLAIGNIYLDINCLNTPFKKQAPEKEIISDKYVMQPGGSALNMAHQYVALGLPASFIGKVGQDAPAELVSTAIKDWGIDVSLITDDQVATNISVNLISPQHQMMSVASGSANQALSPEEVLEHVRNLLADVKYLYLGGIFKLTSLLPAYQELIKLAKRNGTIVVIDHNRIPVDPPQQHLEMVRQLVLQADYYLPSRAEFLQLWDCKSIEEGLANLMAQSQAQVIVKDGANGALSLTDKGIVKSPPFEVNVQNTVGAGDCFNAGFLAATEHGMGLAHAMQFACATAALKISKTTLPSLDDVQELTHSKL